jgi:hypothetical protein
VINFERVWEQVRALQPVKQRDIRPNRYEFDEIKLTDIAAVRKNYSKKYFRPGWLCRCIPTESQPFLDWWAKLSPPIGASMTLLDRLPDFSDAEVINLLANARRLSEGTDEKRKLAADEMLPALETEAQAREAARAALRKARAPVRRKVAVVAPEEAEAAA